MSNSSFLRKRSRNPLIVKPHTLHFNNVNTDEKGEFTVDFKDYKLKTGINTEFCLHKLNIVTDDIHNVFASTRYVSVTPFSTSSGGGGGGGVNPDPSGGGGDGGVKPGQVRSLDLLTLQTPRGSPTIESNVDSDDKTTIWFPDCKLAELRELMLLMNALLSEHQIEFKIKYKTCSITFTEDSDVEHLDIDMNVARVLGFVNWQEQPSPFWSKKYESKITWQTDVTDEKNKRCILTRLVQNEALEIELPFEEDVYIWNHVSDASSQAIVLSTDLMVSEFTGTQLTKTLAVVTIQPSERQLIHEPWSADWKKTESRLLSRLTFRLADTTGRTFKNLKFNMEIMFRHVTLL